MLTISVTSQRVVVPEALVEEQMLTYGTAGPRRRDSTGAFGRFFSGSE